MLPSHLGNKIASRAKPNRLCTLQGPTASQLSQYSQDTLPPKRILTETRFSVAHVALPLSAIPLLLTRLPSCTHKIKSEQVIYDADYVIRTDR